MILSGPEIFLLSIRRPATVHGLAAKSAFQSIRHTLTNSYRSWNPTCSPKPSSRIQFLMLFTVFDLRSWDWCFHGPCIAASSSDRGISVWAIVPGLMCACLVATCASLTGVGSSGVCMFYVLILMPSLVLNQLWLVLWTILVGLGAI